MQEGKGKREAKKGKVLAQPPFYATDQLRVSVTQRAR